MINFVLAKQAIRLIKKKSDFVQKEFRVFFYHSDYLNEITPAQADIED